MRFCFILFSFLTSSSLHNLAYSSLEAATKLGGEWPYIFIHSKLILSRTLPFSRRGWGTLNFKTVFWILIVTSQLAPVAVVRQSLCCCIYNVQTQVCRVLSQSSFEEPSQTTLIYVQLMVGSGFTNSLICHWQYNGHRNLCCYY